jgi:enoyl-[acyl-carrier protein] reductase II
VNVITLAPNYLEHLKLVCDLGCEFAVFAGGIPKKKEVQQVKACGAKTICFASTEALAMSLIDRGADALMLEGSEAGGHIGPVALSVLIQQILQEMIAEAEEEMQRLRRIFDQGENEKIQKRQE